MVDTFQYNLNRISNGFILDVICDDEGVTIFKMPDYEFLKQGINLENIKCVKVLNHNGFEMVRIVSDTDETQFSKLTGGVQPFYASRFIKIQAFFSNNYKIRVTFYYENVGNYSTAIQDALLSGYLE